MKNKKRGFLLFEFLLTSVLGSFLFMMIYQSYKTVQKGVQYINNDADFEIQKLLTLYHLEADSMSIVLYPGLTKLYKKVADYNESNTDLEKDSTDKKVPHQQSSAQRKEIGHKNKKPLSKKEKQEIEKEFSEAILFFPKLELSPGKIKISWISSRKLLHDKVLTRVSYLFLEVNKLYKEKKLYKLYRKEESIEFDYKIEKKSSNKYQFINYIFEPEVFFIFPDVENLISQKEGQDMSTFSSEKKPDALDKKEKNNFLEWRKNPIFKAVKESNAIEINNFTKMLLVPYSLIITGEMISFDLSKNIDLLFTISFPLAQNCLDIFFNYEKNDEEENKSDLLSKNVDQKYSEQKSDEKVSELKENI